MSCWSNVCKIFGLRVAKREMLLRVKPKLAIVCCFRVLWSTVSRMTSANENQSCLRSRHQTWPWALPYSKRQLLPFIYLFFEVLLGTVSGGIASKSSQSKGALQCWMLELALAALVRLGVWLQSCADREWETFWEFAWKCFSHLAAGQSKRTQNIILLDVIAGPSTRGS